MTSEEIDKVIILGENTVVTYHDRTRIFINGTVYAVPDVVDTYNTYTKKDLVFVDGFVLVERFQQFVPLTLKALWTYLWNMKKFYVYE